MYVGTVLKGVRFLCKSKYCYLDANLTRKKLWFEHTVDRSAVWSQPQQCKVYHEPSGTRIHQRVRSFTYILDILSTFNYFKIIYKIDIKGLWEPIKKENHLDNWIHYIKLGLLC